MSDLELEKAAMAPRRWIEFCGAFEKRYLNDDFEAILCPLQCAQEQRELSRIRLSLLLLWLSRSTMALLKFSSCQVADTW